MFAKSFMDDRINVCKLFGPQSVLFLSNDDKVRMPLRLAVASLQAAILMHMEYKVRLPDHNFVVRSRDTLNTLMVCAKSRRTVNCRTLRIPLLEIVVVNTIPLPHIHMHTT